jgi:hypothetical protein
VKKLRMTITVTLAVAVALTTGIAAAKTISITASPNPARVGDVVRHELGVGLVGRLDIWISATGFGRPSLGRLPPGTWSYECCPSQTAGTPAWHYRSSSLVQSGRYRFPATAQSRGTFPSTATIGGATSRVWVSIR